MKNLYIINAGGFGRNIASIARKDSAHGVEWELKGFLDNRVDINNPSNLKIFGDPLEWEPDENDAYICALGEPFARRKYAEALLKKNAYFLCMYPELLRSERLKMGQGCIFETQVGIGPDVVIGDFVFVLSKSIIGYDVCIGEYSTIGSFVFVGGGVQIGENVTIHPHATILPGVKVGDNAIIGAGSVIIRDVAPGVTMFGNPAKPLNFK